MEFKQGRLDTGETCKVTIINFNLNIFYVYYIIDKKVIDKMVTCYTCSAKTIAKFNENHELIQPILCRKCNPETKIKLALSSKKYLQSEKGKLQLAKNYRLRKEKKMN